MSELSVVLPDPADTLELGRRLGGILRAGDLVLLAGRLGTGKTVLVRGIAAGLGVLGRVSSPTFIIAREHRPAPGGRGVGLMHVDAYRLAGRGEEVDGLSVLDPTSLPAGAAVVVEWAEAIADRLSEDYLLVRLERDADDVRHATLIPHGTWKTRDWATALA